MHMVCLQMQVPLCRIIALLGGTVYDVNANYTWLMRTRCMCISGNILPGWYNVLCGKSAIPQNLSEFEITCLFADKAIIPIHILL